ncbi:ribbon-helix-helix protein, CopG family [Agrobacterium rosae]|uniref:ribbon-helix-helix protein, CopG family n=1 Tax=Agrobacterium rosae TaxID=1972867 RepID=UPI00122EA5CB|nr:ribbon-helix-helix protein, CopG family [Agrobacterium rosae]KAA3510127.1 ribbon-helix-helix protein, CopG family [Agrobacterium rosae]KAA3514928.1 ribbon-helix-helix protein, CopG family [Agrobacterium rosae]MQB50748.1 ribbon-helix-helix protein, CopG family [Agrobacterium rosae]
MTSLTLHIDDETEARLRQIAEELQRDVHDLATCAIAEAALDYFRGRPVARDPAHQTIGDTLQ